MKVERERVQARLDELIESYPDPDQARRAYLQNQDAMRSIESGALEEQVVDWMLGTRAGYRAAQDVQGPDRFRPGWARADTARSCSRT